jgi:hypothetical protein
VGGILLPATQLDSQLLLRTIEIKYKILNRVLAAELISTKSPITQILPDTAFYFCLVLT